MGTRKKLMAKYPQGKGRLSERSEIDDESRLISKKFGIEYFDGDRKYGYGGFTYQERFWKDVVDDFIKEYSLTNQSRILDIGCAKGFMLYDFTKKLGKVGIDGIDVSEYAISNALDEVRSNLKVGNAIELPYQDKVFDLVISINTLHNLTRDEIKIALREIDRVSKGKSFIMVDGYESLEQKENMEKWVLTAKTVLSVSEWQILFNEVNFRGDFDFWTVS